MNKTDYQDSNALFKLFCLFFAYTAIVALIIQLVLLPYVFPSWHRGDGLLITSVDSIGFHQAAIELAKRMYSHGCLAWELSPKGFPPSGIIGIIYAISHIFKPWIIVPLNAALHATATLILLLMMSLFISNLRLALCCVLPFLLFPSASLWYAQLHKDGYFILGCYLILYGFLLLLKLENKHKFFYCTLVIFYIIFGNFLIWIMRPFISPIIQVFAIVATFLLLFIFLVKIRKNILSKRKAAAIILILFTIPFLIVRETILESRKINIESPSNQRIPAAEIKPTRPPSNQRIPAAEIKPTRPPSNQRIPAAEIKPTRPPSNQRIPAAEIKPTRPPILESKKIEEGLKLPKIARNSIQLFKTISNKIKRILKIQFHILISKRKGFLTTKGKSNIDEDVYISTPGQMFYYLPRVIQIVLLSPFPSQWFEKGSTESTSLMRKIAIFEMIIIYFFLVFLLYALWYWRRRIEIWLILFFCLWTMLIYGLVICNIGTLYRLRYGFLMILVALGIGGFVVFLKKLKFIRHDISQ